MSDRADLAPGRAAAAAIALVVATLAAQSVRLAIARAPGATGAGSLPAALVFAANLGALAAVVDASSRGRRGNSVLARGAPDLAADVTASAREQARRQARSLARQVVAGVGGAAVLCLGPLLAGSGVLGGRLALGVLPAPTWAVGVVAVAVTEEAVFRGALFHLLAAARLSSMAASLVAACAFAVVHVPLYGWGVVPLDLAVGLWLGGLRLATNGLVAPATAHAVADLAAWWLQ